MYAKTISAVNFQKYYKVHFILANLKSGKCEKLVKIIGIFENFK